MNWSDERYVRLYTRDTPEWQCLSFPAQGLFCLLLRKVNRAGVLHLGKLGRRGVAVGVCFPGEWSRLEPALDELLADGCVVINGERLIIPNFLEAQECEASEKARARKYREMARDLALDGSSRNVTPETENGGLRDGGVTKRDEGVTERDQTVTPSRTVPNQADPSEKKQATVTRLPSRSALLDSQYPLTAALCSEGGFSFPAKPETRAAVEKAIASVGHESALAAAKASFAANGKTHLGWHLDAIASAAGKRPKSEPEADLGWLNDLKEPIRSEAIAAWKQAVADIESTFRPDAHPRALASAAEMLRQRFA